MKKYIFLHILFLFVTLSISCMHEHVPLSCSYYLGLLLRQNSLWSGLLQNNYAKVEAALQRHVDPNVPLLNMTPIKYAIDNYLHGYQTLDIIQLLLHKGANYSLVWDERKKHRETIVTRSISPRKSDVMRYPLVSLLYQYQADRTKPLIDQSACLYILIALASAPRHLDLVSDVVKDYIKVGLLTLNFLDDTAANRLENGLELSGICTERQKYYKTKILKLKDKYPEVLSDCNQEVEDDLAMKEDAYLKNLVKRSKQPLPRMLMLREVGIKTSFFNNSRTNMLVYNGRSYQLPRAGEL